jgi:hypothetical protein
MSYGVNAAAGLVPSGTVSNSQFNGATFTFNVLPGYNTNIFKGDPVAPLSTGYIGIGVAGQTTLGVFQGCSYVDSMGVIQKPNGWIANTTIQTNTVVSAYVIIDPNVTYDIQTNGIVGAAFANNFSNANYAIGTGIAATGMSTTTLDASTFNTTSTLNLKVIGLTNNSLNQWSVGGNFPYNNVQVIINNHFFRAGVAGV